MQAIPADSPFGDEADKEFPSEATRNDVKQGKAHQKTSALPIIDEKVKIYGQTNQSLGEASHLTNNHFSEMNRLMEFLNLKRILKVGTEAWKPCADDHLDIAYNNQGSTDMKLDLTTALVNCDMRETAESNMVHSCSLNVIPHKEETEQLIEVFNCSDIKTVVNEDDKNQATADTQKSHRQSITSPVSCVFETKKGETNSYPVDVVDEVSGHDIGRNMMYASNHDWTQLQTLSYAHLNVRRSASCTRLRRNVFYEAACGDVSIENSTEKLIHKNDSHRAEHARVANENIDKMTSSSTDHTSFKKCCFPHNDTGNNTNCVRLRTSKRHPSLVPSPFSFIHWVFPTRKKCHGKLQVTSPLSHKTCTRHKPAALVSITNSAPMTLCINYFKNGDASRKSADGYRPKRCNSLTSVHKADNLMSESGRLIDITLLLSSPPKCCENNHIPARSIINSAQDKNVIKTASTKSNCRDQSRRNNDRYMNTPLARNRRQFQERLSPDQAVNGHRTKGHCSCITETKGKCSPWKCKTHTSVILDVFESQINRHEISTSTSPYTPVLEMLNENPVRGYIEFEVKDIDSLIPKNAIKMTVKKSPTREVKAICTASNETQALPSAPSNYENTQQDHIVPKTKLLATDKFDKNKLCMFDIWPTKRSLARQHGRHSKRNFRLLSNQPQEDGTNFRTSQVNKVPFTNNSPVLDRRRTGASPLADSRQFRQKPKQITSSPIIESTRSRSVKYVKTDPAQENNLGHVNKPDQRGKSTAILEKVAENLKKSAPFLTNSDIDERCVLKCRLCDSFKSRTFTNAEKLNVHHSGLDNKTVQTQIRDKENVPSSVLKRQSLRGVQRHVSNTCPHFLEYGQVSKASGACAQFFQLGSDLQDYTVPAREDSLFKSEHMSPSGVYPLPSILEQFAVIEHTASGDLSSTETSSFQKEHREIIATHSVQEKMHIMETGNRKCFQECKHLRRSQCGQESEMINNVCHKKDTGYKNSSSGDTGDNRYTAADFCFKHNYVTNSKEVIREDKLSCRLSVCPESNTGNKLPPERSSCRRKENHECYSTSDGACEYFYDALESLTSPQGLSSCYHVQNESMRHATRDKKHGIKFADKVRKIKRDTDCRANKKHRCTDSKKLNTRYDMNNQRLPCDATERKNNGQHIAFRFAPSVEKGSMPGISEKTTIEDADGRRRSNDKNAGISKHRLLQNADEMTRKSTNARNATPGPLHRSAVSKLIPQSLTKADNTDSADSKSLKKNLGVNTDEKGSAFYMSLSSEKVDNFVDAHCSLEEDFFSIRDC